MISSLLGAFINVTILTRGAHWILKKRVSDDHKRSITVFGSVTILDFIIWMISKDLLSALHIMLFYYVPFLILWLLTDVLRARRKRNAIRN
jgi:Ca2+/Na+ antiporter